MADIRCLKTYDGLEIFDHELNPEQKAYVTGTPKNEDGHVSSQVFDDSVYLGEEPGSLYATEFHGELVGNADSATKDSRGNVIFDTYATKNVATDSKDGLMSSDDKIKLDDIGTMTEEEIDRICVFDPNVDEEMGPPIATSTRLGYVKVGEGLQITGDGRLSAIGGGGSSSGGTGDYVHPATHPGTIITYDSGGIEVNRGNEAEPALSVEDALLGLNQKQDRDYTELSKTLATKAPDGFGLGTRARDISNSDLLDTLAKTQSGWYKGQNVTNAPLNTTEWCYFNIIADSPEYAVVICYTFAGPSYKAFYENGTLTPWSWIFDEIAGGYLSTIRGGTGVDITKYPDGAFLCKQTTSGGVAHVDYYNSISLSGDKIVGTLPLSKGGTGIKSLSDAPNNAIIRKGADVDYLYYTATKNGAFYATTENGSPKFGTLPVEQGGTGATTAGQARTNLGVLGNSGTQKLSNGTLRLVNTSDEYNYGFSIARSTNGMSMYLGTDGTGYIRHNKINSSDYSVTEYGQSLRFAQNYISVGDVRFEDSRIYLNNSYGVRGMKSGYTNFTKANSECIGYVSADTNRATLGSWDNTYGVEIASPSVVFIKCNGVAPGTDDTRYSVRLTYGSVDDIGRGYFIPGYNTDSGTSYTDLGMSSKKWRNLWATNGTIETSDRNQKRDIESLPDIYVKLFDELGPVVYRMIEGDRKHTGFIAQDVEEIAERIGLSPKDLGFFCKDIKTVSRLNENDEEIEEPVLDENGNPVYIYSLRYNEYIAIIAAKIKKMEEEYNNKISSLESEVAELKAIVQSLVK